MLYRDVVECFPDAVIEDARPTDETRAILEPAAGRLSWDAPVHSLADVLRPAVRPVRVLNIKPSRFGTPGAAASRRIEPASARASRCTAAASSSSGPGRYQIQALASLFYPDGGNDVAPGAFNTTPPGPRAAHAARCPCPERLHGFAFGDR